MSVSRSRIGHGHARHGAISPTYHSWMAMRRRCYDEDNHNYENYGGRGITYDPRWDDFELFLADMGDRPAGTTLDRVDPDDHYYKANCRWATPKEQLNNTRTNRMLTIHGETLSVSMWAERVGVDRQAIFARLARGWTPADAVFKPIDKRRTRRRAHDATRAGC